MSRYDFRSLSSQDFEDLTRDLLQAEWGVWLEAFKSGRDEGIDLRYAPLQDRSTIVQCKHFVGSGFAKLLYHLRETELPKVQKLKPGRYVLVTSVALSPHNKDEILQALAPYVTSTADVIGADDLSGLLSRHPEIERNNFKLWLTSTQVLERILHNAEVCKTTFEVERIRRKLPLFVQSGALPRAELLLQQERIAIISGVPGIGKTTLAEMTLFAHLEQGFEPVVIQADIEEGLKLFRPEGRQIFYFDDFLGQTFLGERAEYFGRNQDAAIIDFMEMIKKSAHSRFILTTREHILQGALAFSERLARSGVQGYRCVLQLGDYDFGQRARILYNHLYFSDLPRAYKTELLHDDFFLKIVDHPHFSPRVVEWLSGFTRIKTVPATEYRQHAIQLLQSPQQIWSHAFHNQISHAGRSLLLALYTLGGWIRVNDLQTPFTALHRYRSRKYNFATTPRDFQNCLSELDGGFVSFHSGTASFLNPSIKEFVAAAILEDSESTEDILQSASRNSQIATLWQLSVSHPSSKLAETFSEHSFLAHDALLRLADTPQSRTYKGSNGLLNIVTVDINMESRIQLAIDIATFNQSLRFLKVASQSIDLLIAQWDHGYPNFERNIDLLKHISKNRWLLENGGLGFYRRVLSNMLARLESAYAADWAVLLPFSESAFDWTEESESILSTALKQYVATGVKDEVRFCDDVDAMIELRQTLQNLSERYGFYFAASIRQLDEEIEEQATPEPDYDDERGGSSFSSGRSGSTSREDVRQMFSTLRDQE